MKQFTYQFSERDWTRLRVLLKSQIDETVRRRLIRGIEELLERKPEHDVVHWASQGWWYHGTLEEDEWVLIKLKYLM